MAFKLPEQLMFLENRKIVQKKSNESMNGKLVVVTGSTSGVGLEALKRLAQGGANLVMVCRNLQKAEVIRKDLIDKYNVSIDIFIADFSRLNQVREVAQKISVAYPKIDVLINSAGMYCTKATYTEEGFETVFCVNHLASFLFTQLLLGKLRDNNAARIIQVNSEGHRFNGLRVEDINWKKRHYTGLRGYGASKTAQLMTVWEMADRLKDTGVTINAVHPGEVRTNIGNNNGFLYRWFLNNITWHFLKDPKISGEAIYYLASSKEIEGVSGRYFNLTVEQKPAKHALDKDVRKAVWDISMELTKLK